MKNKFFLSIFALVSLLSGCGKDPGPAGRTFRAVVESFESAEGSTKTALVEKEAASGYSVTWAVDDQIRINDCQYKAEKVSGGTASFVPVATDVSFETFKACYPYSISGWENGTMSITLPAVQTEPTSGLVSGFPMYAESSTSSLDFRNLCGLLKLGLKAASGSFTVSSIELKSNNFSLSGKCSVVFDGTGAWKASPSESSGTPVGLKYSCNRLVGNESAAYFYIYLPPGEYEGFDITVNTDAGIFHKVSSKAIKIQRSKVTTISFSSADPHYVGHDYVDLGLPSHKKWATMNVGATSVTDRGTGINWADAQTVPWRGAWRVPTKDEIEELFKKTYWRWTDNYKSSNVAGFVIFKTEFDAGNMNRGMVFEEDGQFHEVIGTYNEATDVHIFLPANPQVSSSQTEQANFWTSSSIDSGYAYRLYIRTSEWRVVESGEKTLTLYVRPVCD